MAIINQIMNNGLFITNLNSVCFGINGGNPPVLADNITPIKNYVVSQNGSNCNNIKNYVGSQNGANCNTVNNIQEFVSDGKSMMDNTKDHTRRILSIPKK